MVNQEKIGIIDQKILSYSPTVKEKIALEIAWVFKSKSMICV